MADIIAKSFKDDGSVDEETKQAIKSFKKKLARANAKKSSTISTGWTYSSQRTTVDDLQRGQFKQPTLLARSMQTDSAYAAALDKRTLSIVRSDFHMNPYSDSAVDKYIADKTEKIWESCIDETAIYNLLKSYLQLGIAIAFAEWNLIELDDELIWAPYLKVFDTEHLKYNTSKDKFEYQAWGVTYEIDEGDGNWVLISKWQYGEPTGFVSSLSRDFIRKAFAQRDWDEGNQAHIDFIAVLKDTGQSASSQADKDDFADEIKSTKKDRVLYLKNGQEFELKDGLPGYKPETFKTLIDQVDRKYQVAILGGNLSSEVGTTGGNRAASQTHHGVEREIAATDATILSTALRKQLVAHIVQENFGDFPAPIPHWTTEPASDLRYEAETLEIVQKVLGDKYQIDNIEELLSEQGIQISKIEEDNDREENPEENPEEDNQENVGEETSESQEERDATERREG